MYFIDCLWLATHTDGFCEAVIKHLKETLAWVTARFCKERMIQAISCMRTFSLASEDPDK